MPYRCTLSKELQEKAKKELNEKPEWRDRDIGVLRDMVLAHKGLKSRTDDEFLLRFLRARKFDYDRAYDLLINYHTMRAKNPETFKGLTLASIQHVMDCNLSTVLPLRDMEGRRIIYFAPGRWDPAKFTLMDVLKLNVFNLEKIIEDEDTQVNGIVFVGDFADMGMNHVTNFDKNYGRLMASLLQDAFPLRMKALHMINEPAVFDILFAIVKQFMKEKMMKRLVLHKQDLNNLHSKISPDLLPSDLSGNLGSVDELCQTWYAELKSSSDHLEKQFEYGIELPKSIGKQKADVSEASVTGTFKKLNVD